MSAFYRAMTLLVVASPCALVLSIPSAILAGIASGARQGILFRGGSAIEKLAEIDRIALDKTGTLTTGNLKVEGIDVISGSENKIKKVACSLALHSNHPVSRNIADHFKAENIQPYKIHNLASLSGMGVEAHIQELKQKALLGRRDLIKSDQVRDLSPPKQGQTEVLIQCGDALGRILLRDQIRTESKKLVLSLKQHSIKVSMLTGDREPSANFVAREVELDDYSSELKPDGKVKAIMNWSNEGEKVAMVGDGVNDAPALASSHISMGMGMRGSDAVLEIADVVLMKDKLENVLSAYRLSKRARSIIHQNLLISLGVIVILVASALGSFIPLTLGVIGHEGSTVIVVMNSLRLLFIKDS